MEPAEISIIIPAYQPNAALPELVQELTHQQANSQIIIVNDGSTDDCQTYFDQCHQLGAIILSHERNSGKGAALKTAFQFWLDNYADQQIGVVTADADGQHSPDDILMIAKQLQHDQDSLHLGVRSFAKENIPLRSRFGNILTKWLYQLFTKTKIQDTQTGLRGLGKNLVQRMCREKSEKYEFEFAMLLLAPKNNITIKQHTIKTIYIDDNSSSHFNPVVDSLKIYWVFLRFIVASLSSFAIDFVIFIVIFHISKQILPAVVVARLCSGIYNFLINKSLVFRSNKSLAISILEYGVLYIVNMAAIYLLIHSFYLWWGNIYSAKIISDIFLFISNFLIQNFFIFKK